MQSGSFVSRLKTNSRVATLSIPLVLVALFVVLWPTLKTVSTLSYQDDRYVQILAAPLICLFLLYSDGKKIFSETRYSPLAGLPLWAASIAICAIAAHETPAGSGADQLIAPMIGVVLLCHATFFLCFGAWSWRRALYPLACLLLMIPIPADAMNWATTAYQHGSAYASGVIFEICGVSALQNGTTFSIPGLDFNIAPECSGIRSGIAFLLVSILAGRLYLRYGWTRVLIILTSVPIAMIKNAVRIDVTTALAAYVDRSFIDGPFHHKYGGLIFAPVDFLLFIPLLLLLQRLERRPEPAGLPSPVASTPAVSI